MRNGFIKNIAIVTGASSGIGYKLSKDIAKNFDIDEIWIIARRKERLKKLANHIFLNYGVNVVSMSLDLTKEDSIQKIQNRLEKYNPNVSLLVNSSGFGLMGASSDIDRKSQEDMINLNCKSLFSLTHICTPYMSKGSGVIQIASMAGFCPQTYFSVYSATKAFVLSYSISLYHELKNKGIHISVICPGPVKTEFFDICEKNSKSKNKIKELFMQNTDDVVKKILKGYNANKKVIIPSISMTIISIIEGLPMQLLTSKLSYILYKKYN